ARRPCRPDGQAVQNLQLRNSPRRGPFKARAGDRDSPPKHTSILHTSTAQLAGYRVEGIAGRGGMGVVYKATQLGLDRPVALKVIASELADNLDFRNRFKSESQLAASIDHPNVVPVYEAGEADGVLYLAMRFVEGTDL